MLSSYSLPWFRSFSQYVRRNRGKIAFITVSAGAAIAAVTYLRRLETITKNDASLASIGDDSVQNERREGGRRLHQAYQSNLQSIRRAFCTLLPNLRALIAATDAVQTARALGRLRERPSDLAEKQALWQAVKNASLTHLISAIYTTALLYSFLSLQLNLLARYSLSGDALNAPVQSLPSGPLSSTSSKRYLDLALQVALDPSHISDIVTRIQSVVSSATINLDLTHTPSAGELHNLLQSIINKAWSGEEEHGGNGETDNQDSLSRSSSGTQCNTSTPLNQNLQQWLFEDVAQHCHPHISSASSDKNYEWLVGETLDLCEVLDFNSIVYNNTMVVCAYVVNRLQRDVEPTSQTTAKAPTFARLFARFSSLATTVLSYHENPDGDNAITSVADDDTVDQWLIKDETASHFGASVFLSGERDARSVAEEQGAPTV